MEEIRINAAIRKESGSRAARRLRREGKIPGTLYGKGVPAVSVVVDTLELEKALSRGSRILNVKLDGNELKAIVREVQHSPLTDQILHVDFHRVVLTEKVTVPVRIEVLGQPNCRPEEGVLELHIAQVEIECMPADLPDKIVVDVRTMCPGDILRARNMTLPQGTAIVEHLDDIVVSVVRPAEEVEVKLPEEGAEPEVIGKVKEEAEEQKETEEKRERPEKGK